VALLVWTGMAARTAPGNPTAPTQGSDRPSLLRSPLAWAVTAFFGLQAFVAFAVMGWLPQVLMDAGTSRGDAGLLLGLLSIVALPISLVVPPLATRRGSQSGWIVGLSICGFVGAGGFLLAPGLAPLLWTVLLGLGMTMFSLALTVIALRARDRADTAALSGMAQGQWPAVSPGAPATSDEPPDVNYLACARRCRRAGRRRARRSGRRRAASRREPRSSRWTITLALFLSFATGRLGVELGDRL